MLATGHGPRGGRRRSHPPASATPRRSSRRAKPARSSKRPSETVEQLQAPRGHRHPAPRLPPRAGPAGAASTISPTRTSSASPTRRGGRASTRPAACGRRTTREACREDAAGAALKAIQCVELATRGAAVHPRWEDQSYPDFHLQRCTQCKRCTEECPFGTLNEDAKGTPQPNPTRCRRCGICMGACPERIISFADYSVDIVSSMIKAVQRPRRVRGEAPVAGPAVRERRLSGAGPGRAAPHAAQRRSSASFPSAAWGRSTSCGSPTPCPAASTASCWSAASRATTTSATSSAAAS